MATPRIQLLPDDVIANWWDALQNADKMNGTKIAQDRLREAVRIGIDALEGRTALVDPAQKSVYDAIETLLRSGVFPSPEPAPVAQEVSSKRPKLDRTRSSFDANRKGSI